MFDFGFNINWNKKRNNIFSKRMDIQEQV